MHKLFFLPFLILFSLLGSMNGSEKDYEDLWKQVSKQIEDNLPKSALATVEEILEKSKRESNHLQSTKAGIYKAKLLSSTNEDGFVQMVNFLNRHIEQTPLPYKSVLQQAYATTLSHYLNWNLYEINQRMALQEMPDDDPQIWSTNIFHQEISKQYLASVENVALLDIPVSDMKILLADYDTEAENYVPSLYDVLARKAIQYFSNPSAYLTEVQNAFQINSDEYFSSVETFINLELTPQDSSSNLYYACNFMQAHLKWNFYKGRKAALAEANLSRVSFMHNNSISDQKDDLYLAQLDRLIKSYKSLQSYSEVLYLKAAFLHRQHSNRRLTEMVSLEEDPLQEVIDLCIEADRAYPKSMGARLARNLYNSIYQKNIDGKIEQVMIPGESNLLSINSRNIQAIDVKIFKLIEEEWLSWGKNNTREPFGFLFQKTPLLSFDHKLTEQKSYYPQNAELELPPLSYGYYALIVTEKGQAFGAKHAYMLSKIAVSKLGYVLNNSSEINELIVFDRLSGEPLESVNVDVFQSAYNRNERKHVTTLLEKKMTDQNGKIKLSSPKNTQANYTFKLYKGEDQLNLNQGEYLFSHRDINNEQMSYLIFTDRSIYRPGQIVHYKVLAISKNNQRVPKIEAGNRFSLEFKDVNQQLIEVKELVTNEFGTASGQFIAPKDGLKGRMTISVNRNQGYKQISVEAYKRPKFYVEIDPLVGEYKLGDRLSTQIKAANYAGNPLQGASVKYRVRREVRFPFWPYWRYSPHRSPMQGKAKEIVNGEGFLDDAGSFEVVFVAEPDLSVDTKFDPVFNYTIYADVTDLNGETHSQAYTMSVSNKTMQLEIDFPKKINLKEANIIKLKSINLNGSKVASAGKITISKLNEPEVVYRKRYWENVDTVLIKAEDFKSRLSNYDFNLMSGIQHWAVERSVTEETYDYNTKDEFFELKIPSDITGGAYKITVESKDKYGQDIKVEHFFEAVDFDKLEFPNTSNLHFHLDQKSYTPGDQARLNLGSNQENLEVLYVIERNNGLEESTWIRLEKGKGVTVPITESDRGGINVHLIYTYNNRHFRKIVALDVPWDNKKLDISFETFRDKLIPGAKEQIKVKISSPAADFERVEMLAAMYDASLDAILPHDWAGNLNQLYPKIRSKFSPRVQGFASHYLARRNRLMQNNVLKGKYDAFRYPELDFGILSDRYYGGSRRQLSSRSTGLGNMPDAVSMKSRPASAGAAPEEEMMMDESSEMSATAGVSSLEQDDSGNIGHSDDTTGSEKRDVPIRKNLNETVFFYPELETDNDGNLTLSFTMGEALTNWKLLSFAHDKSLRYAYDVKELITQKDLMVFPNMPRYVRDKDKMSFQAKVVNLTDRELDGAARIEIIDAITGNRVDELFEIADSSQDFQLGANASSVVSWEISVPNRAVDAIQVRMIAESGKHADGEQNLLPVLTDRMLVTETNAIIVNPNETKSFRFEAFENNTSSTVVPHLFSLEYTPNPAWYAVQALPYLMEYPYKCTEQVMNRFYANALAGHIANLHPKIKQVFDAWSLTESDALISNLEKNEDLKSALLKETPWLLDGKNETANKKRIANLFDLNRMSNEKASALKILQQRQLSNGGFAWFEGGRANRYISQYILENLGHLMKLDVLSNEDKSLLSGLIGNGLNYLDTEIKKEYEHLLKQKADLSKDHLSHMALHYLYTRSFFTDGSYKNNSQEIYDYYLSQAASYGMHKGIYGGALSAISLLRTGDIAGSKKIEKSLLERSLNNEELGTYWNEGTGYRWHELPIERHALMIEYLSEAGASKSMIDELKKWLLLNKQTNNWKTTKGTSAAIYALLISNEDQISNWILEESKFEITLGDKQIDVKKDAEIATGYFRKDWRKEAIDKRMSKLVIKNESNHLGWGGVYWQYFEEMDKVKGFKDTPLTIDKALFRVNHGASGEQLEQINDGVINIGDRILVRIIIESDRSMEYVHLKDMRASGLEPVSNLSGYKGKNGMYYYESPGDMSTDFFIDYLPKGKYVFEYELVANQIGSFSNGICTIQNMYAPEYSSHSSGDHIEIKAKK